MEKEYAYSETNGVCYRIHVEVDEDPWNPRVDMDGNVGKMACFHRRYSLGDETDYRDEDDLKRDILSELDISMSKIIRYVKSGKTAMDLKYNRSVKEWELWGKCYSWIARCEKYGPIDSNSELQFLEDTIIEELTIKDIEGICGDNLVILPLYRYDHSGLTMRTSRFADSWDSMKVGYIWTTLQKVKENADERKITQAMWRKHAQENLEAEVEIYDQYLRGDVYGYILERRTDSGWEETESVWGYYSSTYDVLADIAGEVFGKGNWYLEQKAS